ncbi:MAG: YebC/PmpR family DNA-binding transcriptional regulator [Holosporaceae bacterium]|jgi:YebC/PmpR family DNA-binding regulatory protein|nr:YebC/PmpR family DNA-binding transcriptional regulator [Holosporaceae bacterium]
MKPDVLSIIGYLEIMSGHSQFKNIMYRKGAQDARKAKIFSKISREITVAVKEGGADANNNVRLRSALINARSENMPNDNIDRAIKKALGGDSDTNYQSIRYEGYGPGSVAMIVEGLTDNKNRTASEVRSAFSKHGGSLGESNSVIFQFDHIGYVLYDKKSASEEKLFEIAMEYDANDVTTTEDGFEVLCSMEKTVSLRDAMIEKFGNPLSSGITWRPKNVVAVEAEVLKTLTKLIDALEDNDDVQLVVTNCA